MKTVLFIIDTLNVGGAEKSIIDIASRFHHFRPVFIHLFPGDTLKPLLIQNNIEVHSFSFTPGYNFKKYAKDILPLVREINPVIIHSSLFRSDITARCLKKMYEIPLVNSLVNNSYSNLRYGSLSFTHKLKLKGIELWDRFTCSKVDRFISNSKTIKESNALALKYSKNRINVIYRGRDPLVFSSLNDPQKKSLKHNLGFTNKKIFLNVSRLLDRKGQLDLIRAFSSIAEKRDDIVLLIVGEGQFRSKLENEIERLSIGEKVILLGSRNDVPEILQISDFFVFPSHYEGLPGALIEAMFAKIPVIASDIPENLECVDSNMALIYQRGNVEELKLKLNKALIYENWSILTSQAYKYAIENFEISSVAQQYETFYNNLLIEKAI